jgi:hypothetical protein
MLARGARDRFTKDGAAQQVYFEEWPGKQAHHHILTDIEPV